MSNPTRDTEATRAARAAAVAHYLRMDNLFTAQQTAHPSAMPPLWPEDDFIGQLAVASLLKQGEVFEVPMSGEPHIIVRRHTIRWPGGPAARSLCVPKAPEGTLIPRMVADLRKCERLDGLDAARFQLVNMLRRRCAHVA